MSDFINELIPYLKGRCKTIKDLKVVRSNFINFSISRTELITALTCLKNTRNFENLVMISCTDWIEDNVFELNYILWNYKNKIQVMISVFLDRNKPEFFTVSNLWRQAQTFERELHEMYGINFIGNRRLTPFILEDWEWLPPMRRDFDTVAFVEEHYFKQDYRDYSLYHPVHDKYQKIDYKEYSFSNILKENSNESAN